jgi:hypothetical protein
MSKIKLYNRKGEYTGTTLVSAQDYSHLSQFNWNINNKGYANAHIDGKTWLLHRYICEKRKRCDIKGKIIDHINNKPLDNTRSNLRCTTTYGNNINRSKNDNKTSKYVGVHFNQEKQKWKSEIAIKGVKSFVGYFKTQKEAAIARDIIASRGFGVYGKLNFPKKK